MADERATRVFGFTDIHWSDRDKTALAVAEAAHRAFKPDRTVIGGDLLNCGPFSRHPKSTIDEDAGYDLVNSELKPAAAWLNSLARHTGRIDMLEGNHEHWIERWIANTAGKAGPALESLRPSRYLSASRPNFGYIPYAGASHSKRGILKLHPRLIVVHGWYANKYAAQRHLDLAKPYSIIYHHSHRYDMRAQTMANGQMVQAMNAGCLCNKNPVYALSGCPTEWVHGFWVAYLGRRSFTMYPITIMEKGYAILPNGREVRA